MDTTLKLTAAAIAHLLARVQVFGPVANPIIELGQKGDKVTRTATAVYEVTFNPGGTLVLDSEEHMNEALTLIRNVVTESIAPLRQTRKLSLTQAAKGARTVRETNQLVFALEHSRITLPEFEHKNYRPDRHTLNPLTFQGVRFIGQHAMIEAGALCARWGTVTLNLRAQSEDLIRADLIEQITREALDG